MFPNIILLGSRVKEREHTTEINQRKTSVSQQPPNGYSDSPLIGGDPPKDTSQFI